MIVTISQPQLLWNKSNKGKERDSAKRVRRNPKRQVDITITLKIQREFIVTHYVLNIFQN